MAKPSLALIFLAILFPLARRATAEFVHCSNLFINQSNFFTSISQTLTDLSFAAATVGFATNTTAVTDKITLYGLAQCKPYLSADECTKCLANANAEVTRQCSNQSRAIGVFDHCQVHLDTNNFLHLWDIFAERSFLESSKVASDKLTFFKEVEQLLGEAREAAVAAKNFFGNATGTVSAADGPNLFAAAECTRDLDASGCKGCLEFLEGTRQALCKDRIGCDLIHSSCTTRYENYDFLSQP